MSGWLSICDEMHIFSEDFSSDIFRYSRMSAVLDRNSGAGFASYVRVFSLINPEKSVLFQYLQSKVAT